MAIYTQSICAFSFVAILGACAQPEPVPIAPEPIFNKYGEATGCVDSDGQITEINATYSDQRNPCEPEECVDGYVAGATQTPCPPPYSEPQGGDGRTGGNNPTGTPRNP